LTSARLWTYTALEFFRFRLQPKRFWVAVSKPLKQRLQNMQPPIPQAQLLSISPGIYPRSTGHAIGSASVLKENAKSSKVLLWVGNDAVKKNLDTVLAVLATLDNSYSLLVVGKATPTKPWQDSLVRLGMADRVRYLGVISNMEEVYAGSDILLHPSLEDTFGMVVLEAMAHAVPAIVSAEQYCGISSELSHLKNAWILQNPLDTNTLKVAIEKSLDSNTHEAMSQQAMAWAGTQDWHHLALAQAALYYDVVKLKT
jgi:UDP-glucose:(heptosyl)LPS alpha-1,3-glucosyltransferase